MLLLENTYVVIEYNSEDNFIYLGWKGYVPTTHYREIVTRLYELRIEFQTKGVYKLLSDSRVLPTISSSDTHWTVEIAKKYYPSLERSKIAIVLPEGTFAKLAMDSMTSEFQRARTDHADKIVSQYFDHIEQARQWLIQEESPL